MSSLEVHLLGQLKLRGSHGERLPLPATLKARALLAYLILHRERPHPRERLAGLFWGDRPEQKARRSLSTALWRIRRSLHDEEAILSDHQTVQFDPQADLWLDVDHFETLVSHEDVASLQKGVSLYQGPFLDGFYDDWIINERYRLEALYVDALSRLMTRYETRGAYECALATARRLLADDSLREEAHRVAMRAYCRLGQRNAALEQYQRCREQVRVELGTDPTAETVQLHRDILEGRLEVDSGPSAPAFEMIPLEQAAPQSNPLEIGGTSPLVGRERELTSLQGAWAGAEDGDGKLVFVRGEAGIGKTRLVEEFSRQVQQRGAWVASAACYEVERTLPSSPLADLLRSVLSIVGESALSQLSTWQIADLARLMPELEAYLPDRSRRRPPGEGEQTRLFHVFTTLLRDLARQNPMLLVLEDVHWAHPSTLAWLHYLARHVRRSSLLFLVTHRPEGRDDGRLRNLTHELTETGLAIDLALFRLSREDIEVWMDGVDASVVTAIYQHTEGNPFFVLETQRVLLQSGQLHIDGDRWVATAPLDDLPVPDSIRQVVGARLDRLTLPARRVVEIAAVIGRSFDFDVLQRVRGKGEDTTLEALDELLRNRLVLEGSGFFDEDYAFTHHLHRDIVRARLNERRRQWLHERVAQVLVELRPSDPRISAEVAYHYMRAEDWAEAQKHLFRAGDQAARVAADTEALDYYHRAMEAYNSASDGDWEPLPRAILEQRIGECHFRRGEYQKALEHLRRALALLGRPFPTSENEIRWGIVGALVRQIGHRLMPAWILRQRDNRDPAVIEEEVEIYTFIGWIFALVSDHESFLLMALRALNASKRIDFPRGDALAASALAFALDFLSLFRLAGAFHGQAEGRIGEMEDAGAVGFVYQGLAYHNHLMGDEESTLDYARRSADAYRDAGDAHRWALATLLVFYVHEHRGELDRALECARDIVRTGHEVADRWALCCGGEALGVVLRHRGEIDKAIFQLERAAALAEEIPDYMSLVEIVGELGKCHLRQGNWREAVEALSGCQEIAAQHGVAGDSLGRFLNAYAEALLAAVECSDGSVNSTWLQQAGSACRAALKQSKGYRPGRPAAMRLKGRFEWLRGRRSVARRWWDRSLALAEEMGHRYDMALTQLEIGRRTGDTEQLQQSEATLAEIDARWHLARARKVLKNQNR